MSKIGKRLGDQHAYQTIHKFVLHLERLTYVVVRDCSAGAMAVRPPKVSPKSTLLHQSPGRKMSGKTRTQAKLTPTETRSHMLVNGCVVTRSHLVRPIFLDPIG